MQPDFAPISLERQAEYRSFSALCSQHPSDYSFINIWGWQEVYGLEWAFCSDCVLIRQTIPHNILWAPVGDWNKIDWDRLHKILNPNCRFIRVPERLKEILTDNCDQLTVEDNREHWDYLYSGKELQELKGNRFHKKKNLLNQFLKKYDHSFITLDKETIECALTLQTEWLLWRNQENDSTLEAENSAIVKIMHDWEKIDNIMGGGLVVDKKMIAYTIAEPLEGGSLVIHFEKGCPNYKGVYQAINCLFLRHCGSNYEIVNREQDLGDFGLRKAKLSYNPIDYLKKFEVFIDMQNK